MKITFKNPQDAFEHALKLGYLTLKQGSKNYVGDYMYMGSAEGHDQFKHVMTREYLNVPQ